MAYRRTYRGRRYRRRAVARVRTVTGKTASFVKLPSYKNMAYRGNERSGVLHEIKFVKQIPISFQASTTDIQKNYIFLYVNCMEELIRSADFLKYASQYQDYCPYAVTVSTSCPVSLVGNCLLTNKLYDWPYFSTLNGVPIDNANTSDQSYYKAYLLPSSTFYSVGQLQGNDQALVTLSTFDTFFASHSTSKKLWNANIPYGVRYARYYATSAQKAMVNNIISDTTVYAALNQYDGTFATVNNAAINGNVADINLLSRSRSGTIVNTSTQNINYDVVRSQPLPAAQATGFAQPYTFDQDTNVAYYLWSLQRSQRGQFNPFYYVGVNCNQTTLTTTDQKQILTLTFKFYVYFKNEISNFFQNVAGQNIPTQNTILQRYLATVNNQAGENASFALNVDLQQQLSTFRRYQQNLVYVNSRVLQQSTLWTIKDILNRRLQNTQTGNYLLSVYRDDPTIYAFQRNGFVVDESCYNPAIGKYVFQGYIDLTPTGNANYLLQNRYEPDANTTDGKFITNYAQTQASTALRDDMVDLNVAHTCPQWSQILEFADYSEVFNGTIISCYNITGDNVVYSKSEFQSWGAQLLSNFYAGLGKALANSIDFPQVLENIQLQDPYFYSQLDNFNVRIINGNQYWDSVLNQNTIAMQSFGDLFHFTHSSSSAQRQQWYPSWTNSDVQDWVDILYAQWLHMVEQDVSNLDQINRLVIGTNTFSSLQDLQSSVLIFVFCPITSAVEDETWSADNTLTWNDVSGSPTIIDDAGELYPTMATVIPPGQFTNGQIVVFDQLVKDVVFQVQSMFADAVFNGLDPTVMDLTQEDFYIKFIQASNFPSLTSSTGGWFTNNVDYQQALNEAQTTFYSSIPSSASKTWKKIKGFFKKAWTAIKSVGKGLIKVVGGTVASAYVPGGAAVASTMIPNGISDIVSSVSAMVVSGKKKQNHYINNRLVGITKSNSTGLVKVLITPGVCALTSAQPVDLDSPQFVDLDTTQVDSIDIGDVTDYSQKVFTVRHSKMIKSLPSLRVVTESGDEVDASFVQARLKVQIYMDKPSEDFILPTTAICIGCDNYYEEETTE